jgi:thiol:disulfide interchange protein DsbD
MGFMCLLCIALYTHADPSRATGPHIKVSLLNEHQNLQQGMNWFGIYLEPDPEWHTYWRNPGDSGEAPSIEWQLPDGVTAGDIQWPLPAEIPVAHLVNYGYDGANLLMVPITLSASFVRSQQTLNITADLSWLVCKEDCIPGWATLSKTFDITTTGQTSASKNQALFAQTRSRLPSAITLAAKHEITEQNILVSVSSPTSSKWRLMPFSSGIIQHSGSQTLIQSDKDVSIILPQSDYFESSQADIAFLLTDGQQGFYVQSQFNGTAPSNNGAELSESLWLLALMAFAGGLILNLMPCVLPILSIKALGMQQSQQSVITKSAYFWGVMASFMTFAIVIILLKQSGAAVGWGFHMQEPWVIALLAFLFTFIALSLLDVAPSGGSLAGFGQSLIEGQGARSQFFTGVLAVVVASPCTAPFMAAALGVAMVSEPYVTLILFASLGVGFALPLSLLFVMPALTKRLPKPGPWMQTFRQFLAFPILATVIWLVWIYLQQTSALNQLGLLTGLLVFSLFIWLASQFNQKAWICYLLAVLTLAPILTQSTTNSTVKIAKNKSFSQSKLQQLRNDNQVVLVNMTADWCITCKVNEQVAFSSKTFDEVIAEDNVHYLIGDWTNKNAEILTYLNQYQRSGVPLYVLYAGTKSATVLPQILTTDMVVDAIKQARGEIENEN